MSRASVVAFATLLFMASVSDATAQHGIESGLTLGCDLCHGPHPGPGEMMLMGGRDVASAGLALGAVSRSCLRCHSSPSERARQPSLSASVLSIARGRYVGPSLNAGHPIGRVEAMPRSPAESGPSTPRALSTAERMVARGQPAEVSCATCHDPHRRTKGALTPSEERGICARCHDPSAYERSGHHTLACSACHNPHPGPGEPRIALAAGSGDQVCAKCHTAGRAQSNTRVILTAPPPMTSPGHGGASPGTDSNCTSCHRAHR